MASNLVSVEWLKEHLEDPSVKVVDCRFILGNLTAGYESYLKDHIQGAVYFDLEKDLSSPKEKHGGRHPLPNPSLLVEKLGQAGINQSTKVVAYDDQGGAMASRFWWLLQYMGHENTFVLDGGYSLWKEEGGPITNEIPSPIATEFEPNIQHDMVVTIDEVKARMGQKGTVLIDSREDKRYLGIEENVDPVAGHIPGALNYFWKGILDENGRLKEANELKNHFQNIISQEEVIVYCGSGVTACPNILALKEAGYLRPKLYSGSWSDWCSYAENPVATGKEQ
ncbi:sulfurtransferase [Ammoniphilus resinae]|uniref:Thiosulfate/3-mercaptopyruvate sulfurtransferase n=1 Tax=Ammoniphilus resinae TaxID=861532 RepID=A0ABS4GUL6_9BACL|nr:sulfurtransferase [Ammoniphilus resinae]MBP1933964.1 thiosulfate/3-mercaptopyruvate sulfurtransferase [Ammoniphilus resinae]